MDELEKRVVKEKGKCIKLVEKAIQGLQFEIELDKSDQDDRLQKDGMIDSDYQYIDYAKEFFTLIHDFVIQPFGKGLNQDLLELFSPERLDLNE